MKHYHPKHFIEIFSDIISEMFPGIFQKELPNDLYEMAMKMSGYFAYEDTMELEKLKRNVREGRAYIEYNRLVEKILLALQHKMERNNLTFNIPDNFNVGKMKMNDSCYSAGVSFNQEEKRYDISIPELTHHFIETAWDLHNAGNKIFRVSERLNDELQHTEIRKISAEFLELPYQTICLHIPHNNKITIRGAKLKWAYIGEYFEDAAYKVFKILLVDEDGVPTVLEYEFTEDDIFPQIKKQCNEKFNSKVAVHENISLMQFIASIMLYMNSKELHKTIIDTPAHTPLSKKTKSKYPVCALGLDIDIVKNTSVGRYQANDDAEKTEMGVLKWMVRGHFRNQPTGQGRTERKIVWIRPFMKGKERDNTDIVAKPSQYVIK